MPVRAIFLFLILLCTSCEELEIDPESIFEKDSIVQIPLVTHLNETVNGSSAHFNWIGNEFALEFSYTLTYSLIESAHLVNQPYYNWSEWTTDTVANFSNLDEGNYTFYVKSRFDTTEEEEPHRSISFQIDNISGPALRIYPLSQTAYPGDTISVYLYFEEVDIDTVNSVNLQQVNLRFSGSSGASAAVELNGEVDNLSSLLHCSTENDNPLVFFVSNSQNNEFNGFDMTIIQSYLDDGGIGLCGTGPLVRIPLKVLAADGTIDINISAGQFQNYNSENDEFQEIEFNTYSGHVTVVGSGQ